MLSPGLRRLERGIYRVAGIDARSETNWKRYALAALLVQLDRLRRRVPAAAAAGRAAAEPAGLRGREPDSSFNTAVSFATNTNWQGYGGEATMSYLTQMLGLAVQNFLSAATGMAVLVALIRGFVRTRGRRDRQLLGRLHAQHALHPAAAVARAGASSWCRRASCRASRRTRRSSLVEPVTIEVPVTDATASRRRCRRRAVTKRQVTEQTLPLGPAASQIAIKQLGTNGGGFFNVNSAHPFENPTPLSNFLEVLAILLIPAALCYTFGRMVGDTRQGWAVLAAMLVIFVPLTFGAYVAEQAGNPVLAAARRRPGSVGDAARRQHGRQGSRASASRTPRCGPRPRPRRRTAPSTRCTTRSRRSAGSCRCGSCSSARSSSAASAAASTAC